MKNLIVPSMLVLLLSACASGTPTSGQADYNPKEQARIRLYGQNGKPTIMRYTNNGQENKVNVGGGLGDAFGSLVGVASNQSIGIPQTKISRNVGEKNGMLSKAFYKEFYVPSNSTLLINNALIGMANFNPGGSAIYYSPSCSSKELSFQPESGKDYEVASIVNQQGCAIAVFEIKADGEIQPVAR